MRNTVWSVTFDRAFKGLSKLTIWFNPAQLEKLAYVDDTLYTFVRQIVTNITLRKKEYLDIQDSS